MEQFSKLNSTFGDEMAANASLKIYSASSMQIAVLTPKVDPKLE